MSAEEIEKWLKESSLAKEESKVEMESIKYDAPVEKEKPPDPPPIRSHLLISNRIQHLVRPVNVTLSKLSDRLKKPSSTTARPAAFYNQISTIKSQLPTAYPMPLQEKTVVEEKKKEVTVSVFTATTQRKMSKDSSIADEPGKKTSFHRRSM